MIDVETAEQHMTRELARAHLELADLSESERRYVDGAMMEVSVGAADLPPRLAAQSLKAVARQAVAWVVERRA